MKKHTIIGMIVMALILGVPAFTYAAITASFGGRVLLTTIPAVTCTGIGTGPVVLISSLMHLGSAVVYNTGLSSGSSVPTRAVGTASGIYGAIPFYTESLLNTPKQGDFILGKANIVPNFSTCSIYRIPFPVRTTNSYGLSGHSSL